MQLKSLLIGFFTGLVVALLAVVGFAAYFAHRLDSAFEKTRLNEVARKFPSFKESIQLVSVNNPGQAETLALDKEGVVILSFWATWCGPCREEMPLIQRLYQQKNKDVKFYFLSDEPVDIQKRVIQKNGWPMPFFKLDSLAEKKFMHVLPTTYIIKNGIVFLKQEGQFTWDAPEVIEFLEQLK